MKNLIQTLIDRQGTYEGRGINHEGQPFIGKFTLSPIVDGRGVAFQFIATGLDGSIYHQEQSFIAFSMAENCSLWNLNSNMPGLVEHKYLKDEDVFGAEHSYVFGFGDPNNQSAFREEITIDLWPKSSAFKSEITYRYAWGMPGGKFEPRSSVRMQLIQVRDLHQLPQNLPVPQDDGACDHLMGMILPEISLKSTGGKEFNLFSISQKPTVFFFYPRTGNPNDTKTSVLD